ncbi:hypothetical protein [Halorubrum sp. LN27]|uniref:hypothetical protein n=1 Tax=Halorubrum sp. LN27 TaxID=2801032 RepID=UPI00190C1E26|nr:hypothetical protein [Halorubrum sp. LN27]
MKRRTLILLLGGGGSAALSTGTGAFSSATAERGVEVSVVDDEEAYVGYATPEVNGNNELVAPVGKRVTLVRVTNRFADEDGIGVIDVDVATDSAGGDDLFKNLAIERSDDDGHERMNDSEVRRGPYKKGGPVPKDRAFGPGDYADVTAVVDHDPGEPVEIAVTIRVRGAEDAGVSAEIFGDTREFDLVVEETDGVEFKSGNSGIVLTLANDDGGTAGDSASDEGDDDDDDSEGDVEGTIYYEKNGGNDPPVKRIDEADIPTNETLKPKDIDDDLNNGATIVGLSIDGIDGVFDRGEAPTPGNSDNDNNRHGFVSHTVPLEKASFYDRFDDD